MQILESYLQGQWRPGTDTGARDLVNPFTGETLARCSASGLDLAGACAYARTVGGPALRALTFVERAGLLKALAGAIHEQREELITLSAANGGSTRGDAKFDLDGATGTLAAYASFGKRLGDRRFLVDGDGEQLGRTPRFWVQHVRVPLTGVAVHINAFNFPGWGMAEKMACALLAGVPVIEKPGEQTAQIAHAIARIVADSGILPDGAFQFVCGGVEDLLDHLGPQDCVAFTGSAATGRVVRGHAGLVERGVRVNVEADSVNAAVLAPDVDDDSATYEEFLSNVVMDMTQKAGQKCTAVRRILVPAERVDDVVEHLGEQLGRQKVGDPSVDGTRVGTLTDARQLAHVRDGLAALRAVADVRIGGDVPSTDYPAQVAPTLLVAKDSDADAIHDHEVFGPVATILPYDGDVRTATALVNRGGGGLVVSVYSNDAAWTETAVLELAPFHGRVWIGSDRVKGQALPPGMVLPNVVHGGPGRAGAGEELGGVRGLDFYTQRTAVQGFQGFVAKRFGAADVGSEQE
ncbi:3,4-dehydroadipyl-CoA semialdehyde dehydrogenase [Planctomycetes bacterium Pla163]|uniref:3,4-dehydroadipyl-CoA semialdehyde dehydrogenase n=1 Tax=Rohdeia mirabilis TaxID=2528008 RepID=A0A518D2J8_9BACT|nr:3,4-dehydroadipyl-CoA semialdehyde dehydrogenase [Planctomycetes bacterium Pla163]